LPLTIAWALGSINSDLGTSTYVVGLVKNRIPASILPLGIFLSAALISFATGTSWDTLMPIAIELAGKFYGTDVVGVMHLATIGAVLTGAVFGDHCSPVSDITILSSMASACNHMDHVNIPPPLFPYSRNYNCHCKTFPFKFLPICLLLIIVQKSS